MSTEIRAQNSLALTSVKAIKDATDEASELLDSMRQSAEDAGTTLDGIYQDAEDAKANAEITRVMANTAFSQLSVVENIVGVLDLIAKKGQYELTEDTAVEEGKWYFTRTGTEGNYEYAVVNSPEGDPSAQGYYELVGINESIQNYVSSHMVLLSDGLWLQADNNDAKIHLRTTAGQEGVVIYGSGNTPLAQYGSTSIIGDPDDFHIEIDGQTIGFYKDDVRVAYMKSDELYVENNLSFGHFVFTERANGHFTLKLID